MLDLLFASAEAYPLIKTGGLGDVAGALPAALREHGVRPTLLLPAYRRLRSGDVELQTVGALSVAGRSFGLLQGMHPSGVPLLLLDQPALFDRDGDPYHDPQGRPFADNALRFGLFARAIAALADGAAEGHAGCDLVHLNDWQTGLAAPLLAANPAGPRCLFTIHNLAYQGVSGRKEFDALELPEALWHPQAIEWYGGFSCMKAGINFADAISTVSPGYAHEILTPEFGEGLDGVLRERSHVLHGIRNGIDQVTWNPVTDPHLARTYDADHVAAGKAANKRALQQAFGLAKVPLPLLAFVGRLTEQKGIDALLDAGEELAGMHLQVVMLGTGDRVLEARCRAWAAAHPGRVAVRIGYDEALAHRIEAGADLFLMPSRFEPCGLNQMYSQRYGTLPLVRRVGGLADTVVDADSPDGTGILFEHSDAAGVLYAVRRALALWTDLPAWRQLQHNGMARDFSWDGPAGEYAALFRRLLR